MPRSAFPAAEHPVDDVLHALVGADALPAHLTARHGGHRPGRALDDARQVDAFDDDLGQRDQVEARHHGVEIEAGGDLVDVDAVEDGVEVDAGGDGVDVEAGGDLVDVDAVEDGVEVEAGGDLVDVDPVEDGVEVDAGGDGVDVEAGGDLVDVDPVQDRVEVDPGRHRVHVDVGDQRVEVDMVAHEVSQVHEVQRAVQHARGDALGQRLQPLRDIRPLLAPSFGEVAQEAGRCRSHHGGGRQHRRERAEDESGPHGDAPGGLHRDRTQPQHDVSRVRTRGRRGPLARLGELLQHSEHQTVHQPCPRRPRVGLVVGHGHHLRVEPSSTVRR